MAARKDSCRKGNENFVRSVWGKCGWATNQKPTVPWASLVSYRGNPTPNAPALLPTFPLRSRTSYIQHSRSGRPRPRTVKQSLSSSQPTTLLCRAVDLRYAIKRPVSTHCARKRHATAAVCLRPSTRCAHRLQPANRCNRKVVH